MWGTIFTNYKTSIPGAILLISALGMFVAKAVSGTLEESDFKILLGALTGAGLLAAKDANTNDPPTPKNPPSQ